MSECTTVTVGLDVHARSIRLAAVRADELLEERTLPYDEEAVERALGVVPQRPGNRVETDSRDARKLARRLAGGGFLHHPAMTLLGSVALVDRAPARYP